MRVHSWLCSPVQQKGLRGGWSKCEGNINNFYVRSLSLIFFIQGVSGQQGQANAQSTEACECRGRYERKEKTKIIL